MTSRIVPRLIASLAVVGTLLLLSGCPENASDIVESPSSPSQDFPVAGAYVEPVGSYSVDRFSILFDTTLADAFGRSVAGTRGTYGQVQGPGAWDFDGHWRNGSTDPRLPALIDEDATAPEGFVIADPNWYGGHNPWFLTEDPFENLDPSATYILAFVKYDLKVNAELDAAAAALGEPITQPDELILSAEGAPKGDPLSNIEPYADIFAQANANPFVLGHITTDASGEAYMDVLIDPFTELGEQVFYADDTGDPPDASFDSAIVARSDDVPTSLPRYNYLVLFKGQAATAGEVLGLPQVMRLQIGTDFLQTGAAVNNGYPPFPLLIPADEISEAPGYLGARADSLQATFSNLEELAGGSVYEGWLVNPGTGSAAAATGTYYKIKLVPIVDDVTGEVIGLDQDTVETVPRTSSFSGGNEEDGFLHSLVVSDATLGGGADSVGFNTHLTLAITSSPGTALPDARPFWFQYTDQNGTADDYADDEFFLSGPTSFGNFDAANPVNSRAYSGEGQGLGGVREDALSVDVINMSRPPVGYSLVGWLVRLNGESFRLPDVTGPPPDYSSLVNADVEAIEGVVTQTGILNANFRVVEGEAGIVIGEFFNFVISLEPKAGLPGLGPTPVQIGEIPEVVRKRAEPEGS